MGIDLGRQTGSERRSQKQHSAWVKWAIYKNLTMCRGTVGSSKTNITVVACTVSTIKINAREGIRHYLFSVLFFSLLFMSVPSAFRFFMGSNAIAEVCTVR